MTLPMKEMEDLTLVTNELVGVRSVSAFISEEEWNEMLSRLPCRVRIAISFCFRTVVVYVTRTADCIVTCAGVRQLCQNKPNTDTNNS